MRIPISIAFAITAISLGGCVNARHMCGLDDQLQWMPLYRAPSHSRELVSKIPRRPTLISYERNTHYWFKDKDGALLLCRQDPQGINLGRCNSDGWLFNQYNGTWQVTNAWESACTE